MNISKHEINSEKTLPIEVSGQDHATTAFTIRENFLFSHSFIWTQKKLVKGECRELGPKQFHNLYSYPNVIRMNRLRKIRRREKVAHLGQMRNKHKILIGNSGKRLFGRTNRRRDDNIKWILRKQGLRVWNKFNCLSIGSSR